MTDDKMPGEMTPETPVSAEPVVLEVKNITKRFPGVLANNQVSFSLRRGEILALLGENGAGKSTLMNIVYGLYHQDEGEVFLKGKEVRFTSPREAIHSGIGMVHQHFKLIEVMTVAENVVLGEENERPRWRTLFWAFFLLLVGLVIGYQLTYRQSLLFRLFGNVNEDWQAAQVLMHDSLTLLVFVVFLPFVISRWIFRKMGRPDWYIPAFAIVYLMLLVMLGGAEHILLLAGLPIVAGVVGIFLKHTWPPTRPLDLLDISLPAIIPAGILGFLVAIHSLGTTLQFLFPLTLVVFICAAISASLAWVFTWLYDHWDGVTSALRIGWGIAWRVGLITVAVWIGGQSFRISKMALITAILQHQPDKVQMRELDPNNFVAQPQADGTEAVNPLAKGSMTINQPLNIAWRDI
jgi:ABC-type sugar transport system ATPase subunit